MEKQLQRKQGGTFVVVDFSAISLVKGSDFSRVIFQYK